MVGRPKGSPYCGGGMPKKIIDEEDLPLIEEMAALLSKKQLADYMGMHDDTFRAIEKRQPEVAFAFARGKAKAIAEIAEGLTTNARNGDTQSQIFYLKTQAGWRETVNNDITSGGNPLTALIKEISGNTLDSSTSD